MMGKATIYALVAAAYYLKQIPPAGYAPNSLEVANLSTEAAQGSYQNLLGEVKIVVDKTGNVTITTPDTTTQKKPDDKGSIKLTITYIKPSDLPVTGIFRTLSPSC